MNKRTTLRFNSARDIWPAVEKWANENGYVRKGSVGHERLYQKGLGLLVAPMMLKVRQENEEANLEAWISPNKFTRVMSFFLLPGEMGIESGGWVMVLRRKIARKAVNALLAQLGQSPIPG